MLHRALMLLAAMGGLSTLRAAAPAPGAPLPPPATFLDEGGTRFLTVEWHEGGKVKFSLRSVGGPGQYGRWEGDGEQTDKGIAFAQTVEEGDRGAFYLASGGQGRLAVKLKPGQGAEVKDGGLVGVYHHISEEKLAGLLKKDAELAGKKVEETLRLVVHKLAPDDRPAFAEWKKRWPDLHKRIVALASLPPVKKPAPGAPPAPASPPTSGAATPQRDPVAYWMAEAETAGSATSFLSAPLPPGVKSGWDGVFSDGFGGSLDLQLLKSGGLKMILSANRTGGAQSNQMEEFIPADRVKTNPAGTEATAEFIDKNEEVKDPTQQTRVHLHLIGHFVVIDTEYAERYANRAFLDGVYVKGATPPAE